MSSKMKLGGGDSLPHSNLSAMWDVIKGHFPGMMILSMLVTLSMIPYLLINWFYNNFIGTWVPDKAAVIIAENPGTELTETQIVNRLNLNYRMGQFALNIPAFMLIVLFMGAAAYVIKRWYYGEHVSLFSDFFKDGFRETWKSSLIWGLILGVVMFLIITDVYFLVSMEFPSVWTIIIGIIQCLVLLFLFNTAFFMISSETVYKLNLRAEFKNSFIFGAVLYLPALPLFILTFALPVCYMLFSNMIFMILFILFTFFFLASLFVLVWFTFTQWAYNRYVNKRHDVQINGKDY